MIGNQKYVLYCQIKPYDLKLSLVFSTDSKVRFMQEFIEDIMKNLKTKFKIGRIEQKKTSSLLLPDYKIGEVLEDKDEIIAYSIEYGLTKKTLSDKIQIEDIDKLFIGKKIKRDSRVISRKDSGDKKVVKKKGSKESHDKEEDDNSKEDDDKKEKDDKKKYRKEAKNEIKKEENDENSSDSGEDKSQDLNL